MRGPSFESRVEDVLRILPTLVNTHIMTAVDLIFRLALDVQHRSDGHALENRQSASSLGSSYSSDGQRSALRHLGMDGITYEPRFAQPEKFKENYQSLSTFIGTFFG